MNIRSWILCLGVISSSHASLRNPFVMPLPRCEEALKQLDRWQLQGVIESSSRRIALMTNAQQQPRRVLAGTTLLTEVAVIAVNRYSVRVSLAGICDGAHYHWSLPGEKHDKENHGRTVTAPVTGGQGR